MRNSFISLFFMLAVAVTVLAQTPIRFNEDSIAGVIFPKDYTKNGGPFRWLNKAIGNERFTPTTVQIGIFEKKITEKVNELASIGKQNQYSDLKTENYFRQYFGYHEKGKRLLYVRFYEKKRNRQYNGF